MRIRGAVLAVVVGTTAALTVMAPPAQAGVGLTVAASPNGLVMVDVPTTVTASGFKGKAQVFVYGDRSGRWSFAGATTSGVPLPITFTQYGRTKVKVVPKDRAARTTVVPVYAKFVANTDPWTFGDVQLPHGRPIAALAPPITMSESARCARVDVGLQMANSSGVSTGGTLVVHSTGAADARLSVTDSAATLLGVRVEGDIDISIVDRVNPDDIASKAGVVWYCMGPVRMATVPSDG